MLTLVLTLARMDADVALASSGVRKCPATVAALIRFLRRVQAGVMDQARAVRKRHVAGRAAVGLVLRVDAQMPDQRRPEGESGVARVAHKWPLPGVRANVPLDISLNMGVERAVRAPVGLGAAGVLAHVGLNALTVVRLVEAVRALMLLGVVGVTGRIVATSSPAAAAVPTADANSIVAGAPSGVAITFEVAPAVAVVVVAIAIVAVVATTVVTGHSGTDVPIVVAEGGKKDAVTRQKD